MALLNLAYFGVEFAAAPPMARESQYAHDGRKDGILSIGFG